MGHALEVTDAGQVPGHLRDEFERLAPGRLCSCGSPSETAAQPATQGGGFESQMPSATWLDVMRAYDALPWASRERTAVWLLLQGISEQEQWDMGPHGRQVQHRLRLQAEAGHKKGPTPMGPGSVWDWMADYLNGPG